MNGVEALNEYLNIIHILKHNKTNPIVKRAYWLELFNNSGGSIKLIKKPGIAMALIHLDFPDVKRDDRIGFKRMMSYKCQLGKLVLGANCPNPAKERDHIWPYSLGGITEDRNRADLCESCNRGKSNTIVGYFPWEKDVPIWVIEKIETIRKLLGY